jgi:hypothetical protein
MIVGSVPVEALVRLFLAIDLIVARTLPMVLAMFRTPQLDTARPLAHFYATRTGRFETWLAKVKPLRTDD